MVKLSDDIDFSSAVLGGVILGLSSTGFLIASGKLTGISGFVENTLSPRSSFDTKLWSSMYLIGLMVAGFCVQLVDRDRMGITSEVRFSTIIGALFVGFGTRMGCGCTSGHGISGLPRGSLRAVVAVSTFMTLAVISATVTRILENKGVFPIVDKEIDLPFWKPILVAIFLPLLGFAVSSLLLVSFYSIYHPDPKTTSSSNLGNTAWMHETVLQHAAIALIAAFIFGVGLGISKMCDPAKVKHFLDFAGPDGWDPSLAGVMGGAVLFNAVTFHYLHKNNTSVLVKKKNIENGESDTITLNNVIKLWKHPSNMMLPFHFVLGAALFGIGWGMSGICPGPALTNLGAGSRVSAAYIPFLLLGMACQEMYKVGVPKQKVVAVQDEEKGVIKESLIGHPVFTN